MIAAPISPVLMPRIALTISTPNKTKSSQFTMSPLSLSYALPMSLCRRSNGFLSLEEEIREPVLFDGPFPIHQDSGQVGVVLYSHSLDATIPPPSQPRRVGGSYPLPLLGES